MNEFLVTALSFPTVVWSVLFAFCVVYWLLAATGLVDIDLDLMDTGIDVQTDVSDTGTSTGVLARFGLGGVPAMLALAIVAFVAWITTYFVHLLVLASLPSGMRWLLGAATAVLAVIPGVLVASALLRPVRAALIRLRPPARRSLLGQIGTVTTPTVDADHGMASVPDGGAGLLLQVRARPPDTFRRGERVALLEYRADDNTYRVISEAQFNR